MVWNYHDEDKQAAAEMIDLTIVNIPAKKITVTEYRIDNEHSNSYEAWKKMGKPQNPDSKQIAALEKAGMLEINTSPKKMTLRSGVADIKISLPRQAVSLVKLDWQ